MQLCIILKVYLMSIKMELWRQPFRIISFVSKCISFQRHLLCYSGQHCTIYFQGPINGTAREENNSMGCKTFPHASQTRFNDTQFLFMDRHCHKVDAMYGPCLEREFALSRVGSCRAREVDGIWIAKPVSRFRLPGSF